jgi:hypothetical protein
LRGERGRSYRRLCLVVAVGWSTLLRINSSHSSSNTISKS